MKFCPECGTPFNPEDRFCAECGFDKSSLKPVTPNTSLIPEVSEIETEIIATELTEVTESEKDSVCTHCGAELSPGDRFCMECGFDSLKTEDVKTEIPQIIQEPIVVEIVEKEIPAEETVPVDVNKQLCPKCGSEIDADERFCQECGFDTSGIRGFAEVILPAIPQFMVEEKIVPESPAKESVPAQEDKQVCPQCGSEIYADERFCQECGFDTSSFRYVAEGVLPAVPQSLDEETIIPESPAEESISEQENKQLCPQCGSGIEDNERFCHKCGFDTSGNRDFVEVVLPAIPQSKDEETNVPESPVEEIIREQENKQLCSECGSGIEDNERFCHNCGFDTKPQTLPVPEVEEQFIPKPVVPEPEEQFIPKPVVSEPKPVPFTTPIYNQNPQEIKQTTQQKGKKLWLKYVMIIIIAGALAAAGWIIYTNYFVSTKDTADNAIENNEPLSLMDQELARHKAKAQSQEAQQNKTEEKDKINAAIKKEKKIPSKVLLENGRSEVPKNKNPKNPVKLKISKPTMITRITTDHYNNGMGTPQGGVITIKDQSGIVVASYKALGKTGRNGTPSAKWVAEPNKILNKGTYFIWDSDPATWSKTFGGNEGYIVVEGYKVD